MSSNNYLLISLLIYLMSMLIFNLYVTKGFGILDVYLTILTEAERDISDWILTIGTFIWKALFIAFLVIQIVGFIRRKLK